MRDAPDTLSATQRVPPPRVPPAPPGTGDHGFLAPGPPVEEGWLEAMLLTALAPLPLTRASVETRRVCGDEELRQELTATIDDGRAEAIGALQAIQGMLVRLASAQQSPVGEAEPHLRLAAELEGFQAHFLMGPAEGLPPAALDYQLKLSLFVPVGEAERASGDAELPVYRYPLSPEHLAELQELPALAFTGAVVRDLLETLRDDAYFRSRAIFDRVISRKFLAVLWAARA